MNIQDNMKLNVELILNITSWKSDLSSNINELIGSVLNFLLFFMLRFYSYKKAQNIKNVYKKYLSSNVKSFRLDNLVY